MPQPLCFPTPSSAPATGGGQNEWRRVTARRVTARQTRCHRAVRCRSFAQSAASRCHSTALCVRAQSCVLTGYVTARQTIQRCCLLLKIGARAQEWHHGKARAAVQPKCSVCSVNKLGQGDEAHIMLRAIPRSRSPCLQCPLRLNMASCVLSPPHPHPYQPTSSPSFECRRWRTRWRPSKRNLIFRRVGPARPPRLWARCYGERAGERDAHFA
jgi:hypothetical protein